MSLYFWGLTVPLLCLAAVLFVWGLRRELSSTQKSVQKSIDNQEQSAHQTGVKFSAIRDDLDQVSETIRAISDTLSDLRREAMQTSDKVDDGFASLEGRLSAFDNKVDDQFASLEGKVSVFGDRVDDRFTLLDGKISEVGGKVDSFDPHFADLQSHLLSTATILSKHHEKIESQTQELVGKLAQANLDIANLKTEHTRDFSDFTNRFDTLSGEVQNIYKSVGDVFELANLTNNKLPEVLNAIQQLVRYFDENINVIKKDLALSLKKATTALPAIQSQIAELKEAKEKNRQEIQSLQNIGERVRNTTDKNSIKTSFINDRIIQFENELHSIMEQLSSLKTLIENRDLKLINEQEIKKKQSEGLEEIVKRDKREASSKEAPYESRKYHTIVQQSNAVDQRASSKTPPPRNKLASRGGRPRAPNMPTGEKIRNASPRRPRPQLVAKRDREHWGVFVELEDQNGNGARVVQGPEDGVELEPLAPGLFGPVRDLRTPLHIYENSSEPVERPLLSENNPALFFKVIDDNLARHTSGSFSNKLNMAVVPDEWDYDLAKSNPPPIEREPLEVQGFAAHYFTPSRNPVLSFKRPGQPAFERKVARSTFRLEGQIVEDAEERMGSLYIGEVPTLTVERAGSRDVEQIVIGEEGGGQGKFREALAITFDEENQWPLPQTLRDRGGGWYFLRLYDADGNLLDSLDFRYVPGLDHIEIKTPDLVGTEANNFVRVMIAHDNAITVLPLDNEPKFVGARNENGAILNTVYEWLSTPNLRKARFRLTRNDRSVRVAVDTDRVWWSIVEDQEPKWGAVLLTASPEIFLALSDTELKIRVPVSSNLRLFAGFHISRRRLLAGPDLNGVWRIALYEFSDDPALTQFGTQPFVAWLGYEDTEESVPLLKVDVSGKCSFCEENFTNEDGLLNHIMGKHHGDLFERLELREGVSIGSSLPERVYICMECGWYCPNYHGLDGESYSQIDKHFRTRHPYMPLYFISESDPTLLKKLFGHSEEWIWKCKLGRCDGIIPRPDDEFATIEKSEHLNEKHFDALYLIE